MTNFAEDNFVNWGLYALALSVTMFFGIMASFMVCCCYKKESDEDIRREFSSTVNDESFTKAKY